MKPIHKFNGGKGATLCHKCSVIISEGLTEDLYCEKCEQKQHLIDMMQDDERLGLYDETLEEAAAEFAKNHSIYPTAQDDTEYGFIYGAKWQEQKTTDLLQQNTELLEALKELTSMCYKLKIQHVSNKVKICLEAKEELIQKHKTK